MALRVARYWRLAALFRLAALAENARIGDCDLQLLLTLHRQVEPVVSEITEIHFNFTSGRHVEVTEIISMFQVDRICRSVMSVVESLRQTVGWLVCPFHFDDHSEELPEHLWPSKFLRQYFADVRMLARSGGTEVYTPEMVDEVSSAWASSEQELSALVLRLEHWSHESRRNGGRMKAETFSSVEVLIQRFMAMAVDFVRSLAEDMNAMFRAPNYVSREMTPGGAADTMESRDQESPVTVDIFSKDLSLKPEFLALLKDLPTPLIQPPLHPEFQACASLATTSSAPAGTAPEFLDEGSGWSHRDVSGLHRRAASPVQLLQAIASKGTRLSNLFISVQVAPYLLTPPPHCGSKELIYDPSHCLLERHWAGYFFHLNPLPPFNVSVVYSGRPLGPSGALVPFEVHHVHVPSMDTQWNSLVSLFKSMNHHSPDTLFISPFVGNCQIIDRLMRTGTIKPKIVYLPINPLVPPGTEVKPEFFKWWDEHGFIFMRQLMEGVTAAGDAYGGMPVSTSIWFAQCSISTAVSTMSGYGYELLHVEHTFAVFLWRPFYQQLVKAPSEGGAATDRLYRAWLEGWHCSPHARFLLDLEVWGKQTFTEDLLFKPARLSQRAQLREYAAMVLVETPGLRYMLERGVGNHLPRGRCAEGICECLPPFRGPSCQLEDQGTREGMLKAAMHYITAETERDLLDIERSLKSLWMAFNSGPDYPVVVFHEGLTQKARRRIAAASENRIWFALLPRFKEIPEQWAEASSQRAADFSVGYRAMTRWRSGPVFLEPALAGFDYAMTLDTDSYFPATLGFDPFELLSSTGLKAIFPHLGRESASVVVNFMHYFLLYCRLHSLDPRRTRMLAALIEKNFKWYQQCLMLDIEILRLDWFRSDTYQDFFRYMDSVGGFWLHRWGNNPVRTFAVTLLLEDEDVRTAVLPYAHQDHCSCGAKEPPCRWSPEHQEYQCPGTPRLPAEAGAERATRVALEELSEGLLDLQPWRASPRQLSRQSELDLYNFAA